MKIKSKRIITALIIIFSSLITVINLNTQIKKAFNYIFFNEEIQSLSLSNEEKLEDFKYMYNVMTSSMPMLNDYKKVYGIDFEEREEYYKKLITRTNDDLEYFCVMNAIMQDIPSFHTDLVFPDKKQYNSLHCYNSNNVSSTANVENYADYWKNLLKEKCKDKSNPNITCFKYLEGKYVFDPYQSKNDTLEKYTTLLSVNDIPIDTYITQNISSFNLYYDGHYKKPCRTYVVFNDSVGEKVKIKLKTKSNEVIEYYTYMDLTEETIFDFEDGLLSDDSDLQEDSDESVFCEDKENFAYIRIDDFANMQGESVKSCLSSIKTDNVIIDLRENYGGYLDYASKYVYPPLYQTSVKTQKTWYMLASENNQKVYDSFFQRFILKFNEVNNSEFLFGSNKKCLSSTVCREYIGEADNNKNVCYLVSHRTGSAADCFVNMIKDNQLGTLFGENTGGEGLMNSYIADIMPNSHLVFVYMPGKALNSDNTDNSAFGTQPDVYVDMTIDGYYKMNEMEKQKKDIQSFDNRLLWDNVLQKTVEKIDLYGF